MNLQHSFAVAFHDSSGGHVIQRPLPMDWEPVRQGVSFLRLQQTGTLPDSSPLLRISPAWHESGRPRVGGLTACDDAVSMRFGSAVFAGAAQSLRKDIIEQKEIEPERLSQYQILAYPATARTEPQQDIESDVCDVSPPLVEGRLESLLGRCRASDAEFQNDGDPMVLIHRRVVEQAQRLTRDAADLETGGILAGHLHRDPVSKTIAIEVTALIPAKETKATSALLTFTPATWAQVADTLALRRAGEINLGWFHSHPVAAWDICQNCGPEKRAVCALRRPFFSQDDICLMRAVFFRAFMVGLLCSRDVEIETALFGWSDAVVKRRAFHIIEP